MVKTVKDDAVKKELARLRKLFGDIPKDKQKLLEGLLTQAARLRVRLDTLWEDIQVNGETELFTQSEKTEPYERERPSARLFTATDKNYQTVMKQLVDIMPKELAPDKASELMNFISG